MSLSLVASRESSQADRTRERLLSCVRSAKVGFGIVSIWQFVYKHLNASKKSVHQRLPLMGGQMIGSAELPAAFVAFERTFTAVYSVVSAQLVDSIEALLAVRVRTLERSIFAGISRVHFGVDLVL